MGHAVVLPVKAAFECEREPVEVAKVEQLDRVDSKAGSEIKDSDY